MKLRFAVILTAVLIVFPGCSDEEPIQTGPTASNGAPAQADTSYPAARTLDGMVQLLQAQGLELAPTRREGAWKLNGVMPDEFTVGYPTAKMAGPAEHIGIYIFKDAKARVKGMVDFEKQKAMYDMSVPIVWQASNVLVFYWHHAEVGKKTVFEEDIGRALAGWEMKYPNR